MTRPTTTDEIREAFLRFFEERDHLRIPASSLIPAADPTLLLTNSGMAQFKAYFSGEARPPHPRVTTAQPSFRTTDIENVGDATHLTLFEMLGNFSFADYFKEESCRWALEFWTDRLEFSVDRLYVTIHDTDDEAEQIWLDLGIPMERIWRFGDEDNWWGPAGDEGPCGPCSELHYYAGDMDAVPPPGDPRRGTTWGPNCSDDIVELYNLVFTQYYHQLDGSRTELPGKNIDTGMGLERTAMVAQGVSSIFETDLYRPLIARAEQLCRTEYGSDASSDRALRIVAEHGKSACFLIGDGVVPGNTGRGYVLRRLIRRAMRFGLQLGVKGSFLPEIAEVTVEHLGHTYRQLVENRAFIMRVVETEERKFAEAVAKGSLLLNRLIDSRPDVTRFIADLKRSPTPWGKASLGDAAVAAQQLLSPHLRGDSADVAGMLERVYESAAQASNATPASVGEAWDRFLAHDWPESISSYEAAYLYDTFGFPIEVTVEMAEERGFKVDVEGFEHEMDMQRARGRAAARFGGGAASRRVYEDLGVDQTPFLGYDTDTATRAETVVVGLIEDGESVERAEEGDEVEVVLRETPFFAEKGGQIGDTGSVKGENGTVEVSNTQNPYARINVHRGRVTAGTIQVSDGVTAEVDADRRQRIMRNHTGTHLLHAALREVLGTHVRQSGSLVAPDRLRFDFTHIAPMTRAEILEVQRVVNDHIRANQHVEVEWTTYHEAIEGGALAFFGDKYDETDVRTILIDAPWSYELCGGTHCDHTGDIGAFFILSEQSIGSGLRRIEAVTGKGAEEIVSERLYTVEQLSQELQAPVAELGDRIDALREEAETGRRRIAELEAAVLRASVGGGGEARPGQTVEVDGYTVSLEVKRVEAPNVDALRKTGDYLRDRLGSGVVVLGSEIDGRPLIVAMVTKDLVDKGFHAGDIARRAAQIMGGGGGGRPDVAQAGGRAPGKLDEALAAVPEIVSAGPTSERQTQ